jgi:hypothetical protein
VAGGLATTRQHGIYHGISFHKALPIFAKGFDISLGKADLEADLAPTVLDRAGGGLTDTKSEALLGLSEHGPNGILDLHQICYFKGNRGKG